MYKYLRRLVPFLALCVPVSASMVAPKEQPKPTQVLDYTLAHPPKKQVNHTLDPGDLSDDDLADDLGIIFGKAKDKSILLNAILSNQPKKPKAVKKEQKEEDEGQQGPLMITHLPQPPGNAPLQEPIYTKYVLAASGLLNEKAHGTTHRLSYHIIQTHPSHIVPTLLQWLQKSKEKHLIDLAISKPICGRCKYLLNVVIGYTQDVATSPQGCQGQLLKWEEIPPLALDYLNHYVSQSSKPLAIAQDLFSNFTDLSLEESKQLKQELILTKNSLQQQKLENAKLKQDVLTKGNQLKEVEELMDRELNKAAQKHQQEKTQLSNSLQQQKLENAKLKKELAASQKLAQEFLSPSVKEEEKEEKENYPATYTSGALLHTFKGHGGFFSGGAVFSLASLGNGQCLSGSADNTIKLWDLAQKKCLHTFTGHTDGVLSLAYLGNGQCLSASYDNTIKLWDLNQKKCLHTFTGHTHWVFSLASLGNGQCLSASADKTIKLWDLNQKKCLHTFTGHTHCVYSLAYLGNGQCLSGSADKTIKLWDLNQKKCLHTFTGHTDCVYSLASLGNGQCLSASYDHTIKLWDLAQKKCRHTFTGHTGCVLSLAYLGNGQCLSASEDNTIKLWDLAQKKCRHTFTGHTHWVSLAYLGNGQCLSGSYDHTIKLWQLK